MLHRLILLVVVLEVACGPSPAPVGPEVKVAPDAGPGDAAPVRPEPEAPALRLGREVVPEGYELRLDLDATKETFSGTVQIAVTVASATDHVWLHARDLDITRATFATTGKEARELRRLSTSAGDLVGWDFGEMVAPGRYRLGFEFGGKVATQDLDGLFRQDEGGAWYLFSQFEALSARRAFPCFDEPSFKVPWQIAIAAPADQGAYSNAPERSATALDDGRVLHTFAPTPALPSYLIAVAVGPFEIVDVGPVGHDKIPARILTPKGRAAETTTAVAAIPRIVEALEAYFDMPLPFEKLDSVAIPHFFGAMENPGLITYDAGILLAPADRANERFRARLVSIAGHELAHQWFGDYVTLAWWDDLWLNESFATWMADKIAIQLEPTWDRAVRAIETANRAMAADAQLAVQPLRRAIGSPDEIEGGFDAIAYDKGGAVLTMFEHWIGEDAFRTGVRAYMVEHARGNATADDFIGALAAVSSPEVGEAFRVYLDQPGVATLHASLACPADGKPRVLLRQSRLVGFGEKATDDRWPIRACVRWGAGKKGKASGEACALLSSEQGEVVLDAATSCPTWVVGNADAAGYYRVVYDDDLRADLAAHLRSVPAVERMSFAADLSALLGAGQVSAGDALELVAPLLATKDVHDLGSAVDLIAATEELVADDRLPAWRAWVIARLGKRAAAAPLQPPEDETSAAREARIDLVELVGVVARDRKLAARGRKLAAPWLSGKVETPPRELELVLALAARSGDAKLFDQILARTRAATDPRERSTLLGSLGYFTDDALVARAHELVLSGEFDIFTVGGILQAQLESADGARAVGAFVRAQWKLLLEALPRMAARFLVYMQGTVCDAAARDEVDGFVLPRVDDIPEGAATLAETLGGIDRCIARRAALGADLDAIIAPRRRN